MARQPHGGLNDAQPPAPAEEDRPLEGGAVAHHADEGRHGKRIVKQAIVAYQPGQAPCDQAVDGRADQKAVQGAPDGPDEGEGQITRHGGILHGKPKIASANIGSVGDRNAPRRPPFNAKVEIPSLGQDVFPIATGG